MMMSRMVVSQSNAPLTDGVVEIFVLIGPPVVFGDMNLLSGMDENLLVGHVHSLMCVCMDLTKICFFYPSFNKNGLITFW